MLKEQAFDSAIEGSPIESGEWDVVHPTKVGGPAASEPVGNTA